MNKSELKEKLIELFLEYGAVPEGYDYSWWTRERHMECRSKFGSEKWGRFEDSVEKAVDNMLDGYYG